MADRGTLQARLNEGIEAARSGDKVAARRLLQQVIAADPNNEIAWMWLASAVDSAAERRACLERALQINPNNTRAQEALRRLNAESARAEDTRPPVATLRRDLEETAPPRGVNIYFILAALVGIFLLGAIIFAVVGASQPPPPPPPPPDAGDPNAAPAVAVVVTETPTLEPDFLTATRLAGLVVVTFDTDELTPLPPTFTPTFTPTATDTPVPSETPFPLSNFDLLYSAFTPGGEQPEIFRILGDGTEASEPGPRGAGFADLAVDASGSRAVFVRGTTGEAQPAATAEATGEAAPAASGPQLFVASVNNLNQAEQVTSLPGTVLESPTWSPDGSQIAFVSDAEGSQDIWVMNADGSNARALTSGPGIERDPAWSPDGRQIAFASDQDSPAFNNIGSTTEIYVMNADGTGVTRLTDDNGSSYTPAWSPDGRSIVYVSDASGDGDVYIMAANGENKSLLTFDDAGAEDRHPAVSPDGRWVAFASNRDGGLFQLYVVDLRGAVVERVVDAEQDVQSLVFLP